MKLSDLVGKGKPVVVVFAMMNMDESPASTASWRRYICARGARYCSITSASTPISTHGARPRATCPGSLWWIPPAPTPTPCATITYGQLPAFFIYDAAGDLRDRAQTLDELNKKLASY